MKILMLTDDAIGPVMAGSALRAWELARVLARAGHELRVAASTASEKPSPDGPPVVNRRPFRWAEAVISPPWNLPPRAFLGNHLLIVDGVTPLLAELEAMGPTPTAMRRRRTAAARIPLVAARADAILAAGPAQVAWWTERTTDRPGLPILTVPFGIPDEAPSTHIGSVPGVPPDWAVVLWWGGVWPWLDLETLLAARARLASAPVSVVVPTAHRPGGYAPALSAHMLREAVGRHGLRAPQVVALEEWIPYRERHRILNRSSAVAVLHRPGDEAALSFRTRALDAVWAGVPLLLSEGGEVARVARERGWGEVVPTNDARAAAAALESLLTEGAQARCRRAMARSREHWSWTRVAEPLVGAFEEFPAVRRRPLLPAAFRSAVLLRARASNRGSP